MNTQTKKQTGIKKLETTETEWRSYDGVFFFRTYQLLSNENFTYIKKLPIDQQKKLTLQHKQNLKLRELFENLQAKRNKKAEQEFLKQHPNLKEKGVEILTFNQWDLVFFSTGTLKLINRKLEKERNENSYAEQLNTITF